MVRQLVQMVTMEKTLLRSDKLQLEAVKVLTHSPVKAMVMELQVDLEEVEVSLDQGVQALVDKVMQAEMALAHPAAAVAVPVLRVRLRQALETEVMVAQAP